MKNLIKKTKQAVSSFNVNDGNGVCFNRVSAIFLEIVWNRYTDIYLEEMYDFIFSYIYSEGAAFLRNTIIALFHKTFKLCGPGNNTLYLCHSVNVCLTL